MELEGINPLWEAGSLLAQKSADGRKIFTYIDKDKDENVDETTYDAFDDIDEVVSFHANTSTGISNIPYLGVRDDATWDYLGFSHRDRAHNLIEYIRGKETGFSGTTNMLIRSRVIKVKDKWFAVFGSGPTDYEGTSNQEAHVFVVDLATGEAHQDGTVFASGTTGWLYTVTKGVTGFMNSPVVLDKELNFNVDGVY